MWRWSKGAEWDDRRSTAAAPSFSQFGAAMLRQLLHSHVIKARIFGDVGKETNRALVERGTYIVIVVKDQHVVDEALDARTIHFDFEPIPLSHLEVDPQVSQSFVLNLINRTLNPGGVDEGSQGELLAEVFELGGKYPDDPDLKKFTERFASILHRVAYGDEE